MLITLQKTSRLQLVKLSQLVNLRGFMWHIVKRVLDKDVGLDVELKKIDLSNDVSKEVRAKEADFGTGSSSLIVDISEKKRFHTAWFLFFNLLLLFYWHKDSNINYIQDIKNKNIMLTKSIRFTLQTSIYAHKQRCNINDVNIIDHSFDITI